ncbi:MAG: hypothetical protein H7296_13185 [Bacteroidia bacterium]|nr:hypothetical protein [Bacteroidia bacterium]
MLVSVKVNVFLYFHFEVIFRKIYTSGEYAQTSPLIPQSASPPIPRQSSPLKMNDSSAVLQSINPLGFCMLCISNSDGHKTPLIKQGVIDWVEKFFYR